MITTIEVRKKGKTKYYRIVLPDLYDNIDFDKLALETPPYIPMRDRIRKVFNDIFMSNQKEKSLDMKIFRGRREEIQMEIVQNDKHIVYAKGEKFICPCVIGEECIMK